MAEFILATRGSELARVQTRMVREGMLRAWPHIFVREEIVRTTGDRHPEENLTNLGGSGVFTKELENAVLLKRAHAAVHSLKDLPVDLPRGLLLGAILPRGNPDDVLVSAKPGGVEALAAAARVGTGSPRRAAMMQALRADLCIEPVRGNVPTRVRRVANGEFDAVILAAAGLERLGWPADGAFDLEGKTLHCSTLATFLPAPGQAAIAVEIREGDDETVRVVSVLHDVNTSAAVRAERCVLRALGGGCHLALGARGTVADDGSLRLEAVLFDRAGEPPKMARVSGAPDQAEELGRPVAAALQRNE
jgi:hydroxymethylbilane synthase